MIEKLTQAQIDKFPHYVEKWTKIGLSCEPLDLERAKQGVIKAYKAAQLPPPKHFIVCDSPLSAALTATILQDPRLKEKLGASVRASVRDSVGDSVWASVRDSVRASVRDSVRASVMDNVWASVRDSVRDSVGDSVWASVRDSVRASVRDSVRAQIYGAHDASWLSFYAFFKKECRLGACKKLDGLFEISKTCGWWAPYENTAILQHRHCELHRDSEGRLHNETGMAFKYPDGWGDYFWHGIRIPGEWVKKKPSAKEALTWENIEQRRAACEIVGWHNVLTQLNAKTIDKDDDPMVGELVEVNLPDIGKEKFLKVLCGTGRTFAIPVPPDMQTALQANCWTYDIESNLLKQLEVRT